MVTNAVFLKKDIFIELLFKEGEKEGKITLLTSLKTSLILAFIFLVQYLSVFCINTLYVGSSVLPNSNELV